MPTSGTPTIMPVHPTTSCATTFCRSAPRSFSSALLRMRMTPLGRHKLARAGPRHATLRPQLPDWLLAAQSSVPAENGTRVAQLKPAVPPAQKWLQGRYSLFNQVAQGDCCSVATLAGDPHAVGAHGDTFSVRGEHKGIYSLLSAPNVSFNVQFDQMKFSPSYSNCLLYTSPSPRDS